MISNGLVGRDTYRMKKDNGEKIYRKLDSCLVIPPPKGKKAKAIIKFLGGAFIGAVPEVTYGEVFERFNSCLNSVLTYGLLSDGLLAPELVDLPLYSVGHSNGALFQVLSGSYFSDKLPKLGPREKAAKDPNKPKRPASAFFVFMEGFRKQFKEENPTINYVAAVGKAGGAKWKANK
nr:hypothetical protein [Tanacetum cinerariifolium]